jgi:hypothetical protein
MIEVLVMMAASVGVLYWAYRISNQKPHKSTEESNGANEQRWSD